MSNAHRLFPDEAAAFERAQRAARGAATARQEEWHKLLIAVDDQATCWMAISDLVGGGLFDSYKLARSREQFLAALSVVVDGGDSAPRDFDLIVADRTYASLVPEALRGRLLVIGTQYETGGAVTSARRILEGSAA